MESTIDIGDVEQWLVFEASTKEIRRTADAAIRQLQRRKLEKVQPHERVRRAVFVTVRVQNTEKIGDLLNYLNTHELEFEAEE